MPLKKFIGKHKGKLSALAVLLLPSITIFEVGPIWSRNSDQENSANKPASLSQPIPTGVDRPHTRPIEEEEEEEITTNERLNESLRRFRELERRIAPVTDSLEDTL